MAVAMDRRAYVKLTVASDLSVSAKYYAALSLECC